MKKIVSLFTAMMVIAVTVSSAHAMVALKSKQVESFISSMPAVDTLAEQVDFEADVNIHAGGDNFTPYATGLQSIKTTKADAYKELGKIVKKHGFSSQEEWANVGDAVFLAYIALKAEADNPDFAQGMDDFPPEMLATMPPETRAQLETTMKMVKAVKAVPAENKAAVAPHVAALEKAMQDAGQ